MKTIDMARKVYGTYEWTGAQLERLEQVVALVRADEREACASYAENFDLGTPEGHEIAAAIRARGTHD
jgi:hypothetical protein